jgi:hypothetical protein
MIFWLLELISSVAGAGSGTAFGMRIRIQETNLMRIRIRNTACQSFFLPTAGTCAYFSSWTSDLLLRLLPAGGGVSVAPVTPRCDSLARLLIFFLYSVRVADKGPTSCLLRRRLCLPGYCTCHHSSRGRLLHFTPACIYTTV